MRFIVLDQTNKEEELTCYLKLESACEGREVRVCVCHPDGTVITRLVTIRKDGVGRWASQANSLGFKTDPIGRLELFGE